MGRIFRRTLVCLCFLLFINNAKTELFTALAELEKILHTEAVMATDIRQYIAQEKDRLKQLESIAENFQNHSQNALADLDHHLGNPVNSYLLIKRFTLDWANVEAVIKNSPLTDLLTTIEQRRANFPTQDDLSGAAAALLRLQDTYQLPTEKIANGDLQGVQIHVELSALECYNIARTAYVVGDWYHTILWMEEALDRVRSEKNRTADESFIIDHLAYSQHMESLVVAEECYELGRYAYMQKDFYHTVLWMEEALDKFEGEVNKTVDKKDIYDHLAFATALQGNVRKALVLTKELLALVPDHERALSNMRYYESVIKEKELDAEKKGDDLPVEVNENKRQLDEYRTSSEFMTYEALCRDEDVIPNPDIHKLKCRYYHNNKPARFLKPFKEEEAYLNPRIVVLHDVISDSEIQRVKKMAGPRLNRATIQNPQTGKLEFAPYRISKSAWLKTGEADFLKVLEDRVADFTGLNMDVAEELQVVNYGIGGHYEPHFDFARVANYGIGGQYEPHFDHARRTYENMTPLERQLGNRMATVLFYKEEVNAFKSLGTGNRIATVLFYMSDVEAGGATVFTRLGVKVFPKKGTAAFWFNLFQNGEGNYDTRHAACPVLTGSKWVSNRWIHERGQEFNRPCALDEKL